MTTAIHLSERPAIEYPESDGLPMADNTIQFRWISIIMSGLDALFVHNSTSREAAKDSRKHIQTGCLAGRMIDTA
jgi:hypothetical protein